MRFSSFTASYACLLLGIRGTILAQALWGRALSHSDALYGLVAQKKSTFYGRLQSV